VTPAFATEATSGWYGEIKFYNYETCATTDPKESRRTCRCRRRRWEGAT
jgi:hypothetical protein